jgi:transposase
MYPLNIRILLVNLYNNLKENNIVGKTRINIIKKVAPLNFHIHTLYNWLKDITIKTRNKYINNKITDDIENYIIKTINNNNTITIKKIKTNITKNFNVQLSKTSIYSVLKQNNITYKKTKIITSPYTEPQKIKQLVEVKNKINNENINDIISIDEMSIVLNQKPKYGWSKRK